MTYLDQLERLLDPPPKKPDPPAKPATMSEAHEHVPEEPSIQNASDFLRELRIARDHLDRCGVFLGTHGSETARDMVKHYDMASDAMGRLQKKAIGLDARVHVTPVPPAEEAPEAEPLPEGVE